MGTCLAKSGNPLPSSPSSFPLFFRGLSNLGATSASKSISSCVTFAGGGIGIGTFSKVGISSMSVSLPIVNIHSVCLYVCYWNFKHS